MWQTFLPVILQGAGSGQAAAALAEQDTEPSKSEAASWIIGGVALLAVIALVVIAAKSLSR